MDEQANNEAIFFINLDVFMYNMFQNRRTWLKILEHVCIKLEHMCIKLEHVGRKTTESNK